MKSLFLAAVAALALVTVPALTLAQTAPDFSGKWEVSQAKSSPGAIGNGATVSVPSEMVIMQRPAELHVEMRYPRVAPVTVVYKLDGTEITVSAPGGVVEKARAMWDGGKLVITAQRVISTPFGDFVTDTKDTWSRAGNVITIVKTLTAEGVSDTETAVFDKDQ